MRLVARGGPRAGLREHPPNLIRITAWNAMAPA